MSHQLGKHDPGQVTAVSVDSDKFAASRHPGWYAMSPLPLASSSHTPVYSREEHQRHPNQGTVNGAPNKHTSKQTRSSGVKKV